MFKYVIYMKIFPYKNIILRQRHPHIFNESTPLILRTYLYDLVIFICQKHISLCLNHIFILPRYLLASLQATLGPRSDFWTFAQAKPFPFNLHKLIYLCLKAIIFACHIPQYNSYIYSNLLRLFSPQQVINLYNPSPCEANTSSPKAYFSMT